MQDIDLTWVVTFYLWLHVVLKCVVGIKSFIKESFYVSHHLSEVFNRFLVKVQNYVNHIAFLTDCLCDCTTNRDQIDYAYVS